MAGESCVIVVAGDQNRISSGFQGENWKQGNGQMIQTKTEHSHKILLCCCLWDEFDQYQISEPAEGQILDTEREYFLSLNC